MTARVAFTDAEPTGLAEMVGRLIEANLDRRPRRAELLRPAVVELSALDAGVTIWVRTRSGLVEISNGPASPGAHLRIVATGHDLLALSAAPLRLGLPDPLRRDGRAVLVRIARRRVRVSGMLRHPIRLSRFARLLSVA